MTSIAEIKQRLKDLPLGVYKSTDGEVDVTLWKVDEMDDLNTGYEIEDFLPGYFGIGSTYGDELIAVEIETGEVYSIPFIPMSSIERIEVARSLDELLERK